MLSGTTEGNPQTANALQSAQAEGMSILTRLSINSTTYVSRNYEHTRTPQGTLTDSTLGPLKTKGDGGLVFGSF